MNKTFLVIFFGMFSLVVLNSNIALAHSLWIEKNSNGDLGVCFGEFADGLREKSGGKLDKMKDLEAWAVDAKGVRESLSVTQSEDRFVLGKSNNSVIIENVKIPLRVPDAKSMDKGTDQQKSVKSKSYLYARFADKIPHAFKPQLKLDASFAADSKNKIQIFFDGKPLAKAKAGLIALNGWTKELKADEKGIVSFDLPWPGLYVMEITHMVERAGTDNGQPYDAQKHHMAFSFENN